MSIPLMFHTSKSNRTSLTILEKNQIPERKEGNIRTRTSKFAGQYSREKKFKN